MTRDSAFYRELYDQEWVRRSEIRQAAALPAGVPTLLAGVLVFYARTYSFPGGFISIAFAVSLSLAALSFVVAAYMLARSLFGPPYRRIPYPSLIRGYDEKLAQFHRAAGIEAANADFEAFLLDRYVEAADRNSVNNVNGGEYLHKTNRAVVVALIFVGLGAYPVVADYRATSGAPQRIQVVNGRELINDGSVLRSVLCWFAKECL